MMAKRRVAITNDLSDEVMYDSNMTCCVCRDQGKETVIHHIDGDPSNNERGNLAVLCMQDHNDAHTKHAFARNLTPGLIRRYDASWREIVKLHLEPPSIGDESREYQIEVLLDLSLVPHIWKNCYLALNSRAFENTERANGDIWDAISERVQHQYSEDEWQRYRPLFDGSITEVINRIDRLIMLHPEVIPNELKIKAIRTTRRLEVERSAYLMTPLLIETVEDRDLFFTYRFTELSNILGGFAKAVDALLSSLIGDAYQETARL
jgi:hypothetical protein